MGFAFGMLTVICFLAVLYFFGYLKLNFGGGSTDELEHYHDWKVRGAHQLYRVSSYHGIALQPIEEGEPITKVLWRCGCGDVEVETEEGHWTFEQLSGVAGSGDTIEEERREQGNELTPEELEPVVPTEFCGFESIHEAHDYQDKHCPGSTAAGACPACPHRAHPGVSCQESDSCGCGQ